MYQGKRGSSSHFLLFHPARGAIRLAIGPPAPSKDSSPILARRRGRRSTQIGVCVPPGPENLGSHRGAPQIGAPTVLEART